MADRRHYEVMFIIDPRLDDAAIQQAVDRYVGIVTSRGGEATKVDHWGRRKFSYEINHLNEGYYVVADLQAEPDCERAYAAAAATIAEAREALAGPVPRAAPVTRALLASNLDSSDNRRTRRRRFSSRCVWSLRRNGPSASECLIQSYEIGGDGRLTLSQQILGRVQVPLRLQHRKEVREPGFVLYIRQLQSRFVRAHSGVKPVTAILLRRVVDERILGFLKRGQHC